MWEANRPFVYLCVFLTILFKRLIYFMGLLICYQFCFSIVRGTYSKISTALWWFCEILLSCCVRSSFMAQIQLYLHKIQPLLLIVSKLLTFQCTTCSFFGGGRPAEEEEQIPKGDDVIVELDASLEDLYMGGTLKVNICLLLYISFFVFIFWVECEGSIAMSVIL